MNKEEFLRILHSATQELLTLTHVYISDPLPDICCYRHKHLPGREVGPIIAEREVVDLFWHDGRVPEWITIVVGEIRDNQTVVHLTASKNDIDPDADEWQANWAKIGPPTRDLLPFLLRLPPCPKGWRLLTNGIPDMARSLAENELPDLPVPERTNTL